VDNLITRNSEDIQKSVFNSGTMTIKQISEALNCSRDTIEYTIKKIMPEKMQQGKTTILNEVEVTAIKLELDKSSNFRNVSEVNTDLEMLLLSKKVDQWKDNKITALQSKNQELESTVKMLVHDCTKTYTTTQIAKELHMKSAQELNKKLYEMKVQYYQNGTWVLSSKFSDSGYTETKQEEKNGIVIYHTQWTGIGRQFLLELFKESKSA